MQICIQFNFDKYSSSRLVSAIHLLDVLESSFFFTAIANFNQANFKRSPSTPMAVTAAPAPAPCTVKGRGLYLSVWNMIMLSEPPREVAKGWSVGYLQKSQLNLGDPDSKDHILF
jgi:hypothetical protein